MKETTDKIDFVIPWVDGSDPEWQKEFNKYKGELDKNSWVRECNYRDWDILKYWFRGVEQNCPWVNNIYFVTNGQKPEWLNLNHPKLKWVKHTDFIPERYLPTFCSHTIDLNLHRIEGLSEHFVYFNDDMFVLDKLTPERFFKNGLPCDMAVCDLYLWGTHSHIVLNDCLELNKHFNKYEVIKKHPLKWFNLKYRRWNIRTLALLKWNLFNGFKSAHGPNPFLKSTFNEVWDKCHETLDNTCQSRYKSIASVNQYIFQYWQFAKGMFSPFNATKSVTFLEINDRNTKAGQLGNAIRRKEKRILCLNDGDVTDVESAKRQMIESFEYIFPDKSTFEL